MSTLFADLRQAARSLRKQPAFFVTAAITLALGIGASTAIFSVVNAVLLQRLPYTNAERLVLVWSDLRARNVVDFPIAPADFADIRDQSGIFEAIAAVDTFRAPLSGDDGEPEQIRVATVTTSFLPLVGGRVAVGRGFIESDGVPPPPDPAAQAPGQPGAAQRGALVDEPAPPRRPLAGLLSHGFWQRRYGGDRSVIGRTVDLDGGLMQVVGVLEPGVELLFPADADVERQPDVWTPMRIDYATASRTDVFMRVVARLKPGMDLRQAQSRIDALAADLRQRFPIKQTSGMYFRLESMHEDLVSDVRPGILILLGAVLFVLLIACANVANLLLVRMSSRTRELAVRAALGGSRWRLVRQTLVESLLLAAGGTFLGLVLAQLGINLLLLLRPDNLPRIESIAINPTVLIFATAAAVVAALVFGMMPAWSASRPQLIDVLRASGRTASLGGGGRLRNGVVIAEVALSFVLLVGSGLMVRSFSALQDARPGFDPSGLLTFAVQLTGQRYDMPPERAAAVEQLRERLRALPGVTAVSAGGPVPLEQQSSLLRWGPEEAQADPTRFQQAFFRIVLPGYFEIFRTQLLEGRTFGDPDNVPDLRRVVIDRRLAAKAFPNGGAVGRHILARVNGPEAQRFEVIGVVDHQRTASLAVDGREGIYFTDGFMRHGRTGSWLLRTSGDPERLASAVRAEVRRFDSRLAVADLRPMSAYVDRAQAPTRFALVLIGLFSAIAAVLAAVGLYGVLSTTVRQRTAEIGVRMAFGATPRGIFRQMVGQGLKLSAIGIAVGFGAALLLTRLMGSLLVGVTPTDPVTFAAIILLFLVIASAASWLPARRAARLDPTGALRAD